MKTTSAELSIKLKAVGAKQGKWDDGDYWALDTVTKKWKFWHGSNAGTDQHTDWCRSFNTDELLDRMAYIENGSVNLDVSFAGSCAKWSDGELWRDEWDAIPAEALGKLYLWCLQNGHCKE